MPHYVYEIPVGAVPNRRIGEFAGYAEASDFAIGERQKQSFHDATMVTVIHAATAELADVSARRLHKHFDEARKSRPAPTARVSHFVRTYDDVSVEDIAARLRIGAPG